MRFHGGSFRVNRETIDFSINTNPIGVPTQLKKNLEECFRKDIYTVYPDYNYTELKKGIAYFYDIKYDSIIPSNGASEALNYIIIALNPSTLIVVSPSYGDYELLCEKLHIKCIYENMMLKNNFFEIDYNSLVDIAKESEKPLIIITNPNNPTGSVAKEKLLCDLADELKNKAWILVDEAYAELSGYQGLLNTLNQDNIIVVRSFTKIFSIPGLRIGFMYGFSRKILNIIDSIRPTWNINSIVECALKKAFLDCKEELWDFIRKSAAYVKTERKYMLKMLSNIDYKVYKSETNFLLLKHPQIDTVDLYNYLLKKHNILVRPAYTFYGLTRYHTRISIRNRRENMLLVRSLGECQKIY